MNIIEYGIIDWLVDYHFIATIITLTITTLIVAKDDIKILIKEITND